ncbi:MAG TPA: hypothetical protein VJO99_13095 [Burkholderiaceae bacterium]|nr:hypothetical protein [Burkholderiaceae bacterium]
MALTAVHHRRLREVYRSAGWPCQDLLEVELLAAGLLERVRGALGHETLRVTDAGIAVLAQTLQRNRARRDLHEALVERVAREMARAGRIAWRGLSLRAKVPTGDEPGAAERWVMAMPDVFSIRHTTVEAYLEPIVHEVKVNRSDLLGELRNPAKRAAYMQLCGEFWYVLREGIAEPDEIPADCGVMIAAESRDGEAGELDVARPAAKRPMQMPFAVWMALARATPSHTARDDDEAQQLL